ncbi:plastocyanin [Gloeothece citriformis PCC 7424]|uniref:Plastocyanin n=1 Tax=Gloeothece citriformis (strain PCC 7424) TaxID=65393 RepID=B7K9D9_GLOC7|nr:plastocyanin [Gloeothece citriformis]ACK68622.1 plastocyanin [Gloeothece citriformis PCC 7424]
MLNIERLKTLPPKKLSKQLSFFLVSLMLIMASFLILIKPSLAETYKVLMGTDDKRLKFVPETVIIKSGDTVKWINNLNTPCNVVFDNPEVPQEIAEELSHKELVFAIGDTYESTFSDDIPSGEYTYSCQPNRGANMVGKIVVQ